MEASPAALETCHRAPFTPRCATWLRLSLSPARCAFVEEPATPMFLVRSPRSIRKPGLHDSLHSEQRYWRPHRMKANWPFSVPSPISTWMCSRHVGLVPPDSTHGVLKDGSWLVALSCLPMIRPGNRVNEIQVGTWRFRVADYPETEPGPICALAGGVKGQSRQPRQSL